MTEALEVRTHDSIAEIPAEEWDACAFATGDRPLDPFMTHRFLFALEQSGSVGPRTGWQPLYLSVHKGGQIIGVAPLFAKGHSQGEYVFDHSWAHAYERAGGEYYPKLQIAAPFTPATGRRFLTREGFEAEGLAALVQGAVEVTANNGLSSLHVTFCTEAEAIAGEALGLLHRTGQQFHWENRDYETFDDFLAELSSRKRKTIRRERQQAQAFGGEIIHLTGDDLKPEHWDAFWQFYQDTGSRKWGSPYLTRAFFDLVQETMRDDVLLVLAELDGRYVAGALNFIGAETIFGRYWGCTEFFPCLHFELCYYQAIDYAIAHGLRVEAGAQGEHKLARGYLPHETHSLHWIADSRFRQAVEDFIVQEKRMVDEEIEILTSYGPFKQTTVEEQD
ncbi:N-acetyltransferase [Marivivens donghaensis]|uniref:N-acetyltransferase n=1 Tax=Marivivens donghaensis TaxID=1699413 RepID=A0ABX0VUD3_9RHOB|nr:GNAT family N-acetyltransferase [Marivivens donghaensis]NIY71661.1 N-acetyltransferase [Marivivens donghaensis]